MNCTQSLKLQISQLLSIEVNHGAERKADCKLKLIYAKYINSLIVVYFWVLSVPIYLSLGTVKSIEVKIFGGSFTHSSLVRSFVSLTRSLKHPREYMLSRTSGSRSVMEKILFKHTRRGGGCSGQGSLRPPLLGDDSLCSMPVQTQTPEMCKFVACAERQGPIVQYNSTVQQDWNSKGVTYMEVTSSGYT